MSARRCLLAGATLATLVAPFVVAPRVAAAAVPADASLVVSFRPDADVRLRGRTFASLTGDDVSRLNADLVRHPRARVMRLIERSKAEVDAERDRLLASGHRNVPDLNRHYRLVVDNAAEREAIILELQALP